VLSFAVECCDNDNVQFYATYGAVVGRYTSAPICLPVESEALLEQGAADYEFQEQLSERQFRQLLDKVKEVTGKGNGAGDQEMTDASEPSASSLRTWEATYSHFTFTEKRLEGDVVVVLDAAQQVKGMTRTQRLGELTFYRPNSDLHYQVAAVTRRGWQRPAEMRTDPPTLGVYGREVHQWRFKGKTGGAAPPWQLMMIRIQQQDEGEDDEMDGGALSSSSSAAAKEGGVRHQVRLVADFGQLKKQYMRLIEGKPNGLAHIVRDLLRNMRAFAEHIDEALAEDRTYLYPNYFGDVAAAARRHYDQKKIDQGARGAELEALRRYNNEVKRTMIDMHVSQYNNATVLDLACGHGQDLLKYVDLNIRKYIGIDISSKEIDEARRRYKEGAGNRFRYEAKFYVGSLLDEKCYEPLKGEQFDVVSIQLAIHYLMYNQQAATDFLRKVSRHLKPGGVFIGSTSSCDMIARNLKRITRRFEAPTVRTSHTHTHTHTHKYRSPALSLSLFR